MWEKSWSIWRSHGFEELQGAVFRSKYLQASQTPGEERHSRSSSSRHDRLPPEEEDFRCLLIESAKELDKEPNSATATLGREILNDLLAMPWTTSSSLVLRLTWLALVQRPRHLGCNTHQLEAAFVTATSGVPLHPINDPTVATHAVRKAGIEDKRANLRLPKLLPSWLFHSPVNEGPSHLPTNDLEALYQSLLTEESEVGWVLLKCLHRDSVSQVKHLLTKAASASSPSPPLLTEVPNEIGMDDPMNIDSQPDASSRWFHVSDLAERGSKRRRSPANSVRSTADETEGESLALEFPQRKKTRQDDFSD